MFRTVMCVSCAFAWLGTLLALPPTSLGGEPITSADEIENQLTRGLAIQGSATAATQPNSVNLYTVTFVFGSFQLTMDAERQLDEVGTALNRPALKSSRIEIAGHTDSVGDSGYNQRLSVRRAQAVVDYLVNRNALDRNRLSAVGWGESQLLPGETPDSAANRRVEILNYGQSQ